MTCLQFIYLKKERKKERINSVAGPGGNNSWRVGGRPSGSGFYDVPWFLSGRKYVNRLARWQKKAQEVFYDGL